MDLLVTLLQDLDSRVGRYGVLGRYYEGRPPLAYLSEEAKIALQNFHILSVNVCRLQVNSIAERLRIIGITGADGLWSEWVRNDLDLLASVAHREALLFGSSYACVWADDQGRPRVTIESPLNVTIARDPVTREVTSAAKRINTERTTEAWLYLPDRVEHYRAGNPGATVGGFHLMETVDNPLGVVPVVPIVNSDRLDGDLSEIDDLAPLVDALNKLLTDMMIASEYSGRPRRTAVGVELTDAEKLDDAGNPVLENGEPVMETVNPFPEKNRMMVAENENAKIGQLPATDLAGFENGVRVIVSMIMAVSSLPSHYLGVLHSQPTSADAVRTSEASLTARAEAKQRSFAKSWEAVCRLIVAIRDSVDVDSVDVQIVWGDAASRSVAQDADAAAKLYQSGILSRTAVLKRLGLTADEIAEELENVTRDAKIGHDVKFGSFLSDLSTASGRPDISAA